MAKGKSLGFGSALKEAQDAASGEGGFKSLLNDMGGLSASATEAAGALLPVVAGIGAAGLAADELSKHFETTALGVNSFATATGTSLTTASQWNVVAGDMGVNADTVQGAMGRMNKNIDTGKVSLADYGVTAQDTSGQFIQILQHLQGITDETQQAAGGRRRLRPVVAEPGAAHR